MIEKCSLVMQLWSNTVYHFIGLPSYSVGYIYTYLLQQIRTNLHPTIPKQVAVVLASKGSQKDWLLTWLCAVFPQCHARSIVYSYTTLIHSLFKTNNSPYIKQKYWNERTRQCYYDFCKNNFIPNQIKRIGIWNSIFQNILFNLSGNPSQTLSVRGFTKF